VFVSLKNYLKKLTNKSSKHFSSKQAQSAEAEYKSKKC